MNERVSVSRPRRHRARPRPRRAASDIDEQTGLGDVYMNSLVRTQLRLSITVAAVSLGALVVLPLIFTLAPSSAGHSILGAPLPWLLLGVLVYPMLLGVSWYYVRAAEKVEREFTELIDRR